MITEARVSPEGRRFLLLFHHFLHRRALVTSARLYPTLRLFWKGAFLDRVERVHRE